MNLLACGGIEAVNPGTLDAAGVAGAVAAAGVPAVAVVCGTDGRYGAEASDVVAAARQAGVQQVYLAGPEKAVTGAVDKPDGYLTAQIDAVGSLVGVVDPIGGMT